MPPRASGAGAEIRRGHARKRRRRLLRRRIHEHLPAPKVEVVDTTGAGDAFVGALAARLAARAPLKDAVAYAVRAGAAAVTEEGAQGALPTPEWLRPCIAAPAAASTPVSWPRRRRRGRSLERVWLEARVVEQAV